MTCVDLFLGGSYSDIAEQIDTGPLDPEVSRALVVFNAFPEPKSGSVRMQVDMSWKSSVPLPQIAVQDLLTDQPVPSRVTGLNLLDFRLSFALEFIVADIGGFEYKCYAASYCAASPQLIWPDDAPETGCPVVETLPHSGPLPLSGPIEAQTAN